MALAISRRPKEAGLQRIYLTHVFKDSLEKFPAVYNNFISLEKSNNSRGSFKYFVIGKNFCYC